MMTSNLTLIIIGMAIVTYLTRIGGIWVMSRVRVTPVIERFLDAMSGSVLVAFIVPEALEGGWTVWVATAVTIAVMLLKKQMLLAVLSGVATAALLAMVA